MNYSGGGTIYANTSFQSNSEWWTTGAGSNYQYVEMEWAADFGSSAYDVLAELYVCLANQGSTGVTGYVGYFYSDGSTLVCDVYMLAGFGPSYLSTLFGFNLPGVGDTFGLEFNDSANEIAMYHNGSYQGGINDSTYAGQDGMGIGSQVGWVEFTNVYMEQPSGGGAQSVFPSGIASAAAFGTPTLTPGNLNLSISGIPSAEAFGSVGAPSQQAPGLGGIASAGAFGTIQSLDQQVTLSGIPSQEAFGGIGGMNEQVLVAGIPSAEAFGNVTIVGGTQSAGNSTRMLMTGVGN